MNKRSEPIVKISRLSIEKLWKAKRKLQKAKRKLQKRRNEIEGRINYILEILIHDVLFYKGPRSDWTWYFEGAFEDKMGELNIYTYDGKSYVHGLVVEFINKNKEVNIVQDILFKVLEDHIPIDYLTSDGFKEEYERAVKEIKNNMAEKKSKSKAKSK